MSTSEKLDDPRRAFLIKALAMGLYASGTASSVLRPVFAMGGKVPKELTPGKSIYDVQGVATVNGQQATLDTQIPHDAQLETGDDGHLIFAVGQDAFVLRANSSLKLEGNSTVVDTLRLITGRLLSVFGKTQHVVNTTVATIGIRGTGVYVEADPEKSYICTCYGITELGAINDPGSRETIEATHHDAPKYILANGDSGKLIVPAPFINHTDSELALLEALVGREPPIVFSDDAYESPQREY
jgi:hypothetical protein